MTQCDTLRDIKAVSFDGDMTLWDFEEATRRALGVVLDELRRCVASEAAERLTVARMIEIRDQVADEMRDETYELGVIRLEAVRRTVAAVGGDGDELAERLNTLYFEHRYDVRLFADALPILDALDGDYALGLLSNGNTPPERCGLAGRFGFVVFPGDVETVKPDGRFFGEACRRAGCAPEEMLHVGDSLVDDVGGANDFGAVSVWLNRRGVVNESDIEPAAEISSLLELGPMLGCES